MHAKLVRDGIITPYENYVCAACQARIAEMPKLSLSPSYYPKPTVPYRHVSNARTQRRSNNKEGNINKIFKIPTTFKRPQYDRPWYPWAEYQRRQRAKFAAEQYLARHSAHFLAEPQTEAEKYLAENSEYFLNG